MPRSAARASIAFASASVISHSLFDSPAGSTARSEYAMPIARGIGIWNDAFS